jgi:hypothetical protein
MARLRSTFHWSTLLSLVAWAILGVACAIVYMDANREEFQARPARVLAGLYLLLLAVWGMSLLAAVVHEMGHALAAALIGRRIYSFAIGPVGWSRDYTGRLHFGRVRRFKGNAGYVIAFGDRESHTRYRDVVYFLGGCAANLLLAFACLAVCFTADTATARGAALALCYINALFAGINLLPFHSRSGLRSDGRWVVDRLLNRILPEHEALTDAARLQFTGVRPRDLPKSLVERIQRADRTDSTSTSDVLRPADDTVVARHLLHEVALDSGDMTEATRHYRWLIEQFDRLPDHLQNALASTLAWYAAMRLSDGESARGFIAGRAESPTHAPFRTSACAAIAMALGDVAEAQRLSDQSFREFEKFRSFHAGDALDRLNEVRAAAYAANGVGPPVPCTGEPASELRSAASHPQSPLP